MTITKQQIISRLKDLAVKTGHLYLAIPYNAVNKVYINQVVRCSSSSSANYRAACRGKSKADFVNKLRIVEEELDETMHFYELLAEFNEPFKKQLRELYKEANELLSIIVASINTSLKNNNSGDKNKKSEIANPKSEINHE